MKEEKSKWTKEDHDAMLSWMRKRMSANLTWESIQQAIIDNRDEHRKEFDDVEWNQQQVMQPPKFREGDIVEFKVGGFGVISTHPKNWSKDSGWAPSYATRSIDGMKEHATSKCAWHYEKDFTLVEKGLLHKFES